MRHGRRGGARLIPPIATEALRRDHSQRPLLGVLGVVAPEFDERNPAVLAMIGVIIDRARRAGWKVEICGHAPSDYPEMVRFRAIWDWWRSSSGGSIVAIRCEAGGSRARRECPSQERNAPLGPRREFPTLCFRLRRIAGHRGTDLAPS